jgi:phospholipid/cholesterol/gamma-HCH transport system substrate-binding protein
MLPQTFVVLYDRRPAGSGPILRRREPLPAPSPQPRPLRWAPVALLLAAAIALVLILTGGGAHHYRLLFQDAGQLVKGDRVRIGGTPAGTITSIDLADDGEAAIDISVDDRFGPLREGTTAVIRQQGIASIAGRYVDLSPAPTIKPALADGATIGGEKTTSIVDLDQLFDTLDPKTRAGLKQFIDGSADWYEGEESQANASAKAFPGALSGLDQLATELTADNANLSRFLVKTGDAMSALSAHKDQLTDLVTHTRQTTAALSANTESLDQTLSHLAPALRQGTSAFVALRPALTQLRMLVDVAGPATKDLAPFAAQLRPVLDEAVPTFARLREMFAQPGADNDLLDALKDLPALDANAKTGFAEGEKALSASSPIFSFVRPYVPDLVGWVRNFGQVMSTYDANGHYARTLPVFDADESNGTTLTAKPFAQRGSSASLKTNQLRRCPGAAAPPLPDGSAPFVDDGPLANPDCDPTQVPGATG